ncbi:MAG: MFS transporter [Roseibium sp.]|nr:MFS transporter [Roseibium sp.]
MRFLRHVPRQGVLIFGLQLTHSTCVSALIPLMGYFIVAGLGSQPWQVGLYTGLVMPLTLIATRWAGERLDKGFPVRRLLLISVAAYLMLTAILTRTDSLLILIAAAAPLMSLANLGSGTIFTFGRLYATQNGLDVAKVNSWLRMAVSLAWMIGPAVSFFLAARFGFAAAFSCAFALGLVYALLWYVVVPREFRAPQRQVASDGSDPINWGLRIAGLICLGFVITNSLFVSAMPLFFIKDVGLPGATPGLSLTVKCLVEVFIIFASVRLAARIGLRQVLMIAACLGAVSMMLFAQAGHVWQVLVISALEGVYYGLFAGVAITFVQSFAPDRPGRATAVYMNSLFLGGMIGSVSMGFIASAADFKTVLFVAASASLAAFAILLATWKVQPRPHAQEL